MLFRSPGPDFSPQYAMTTDPGEPVILATLADAGGELMSLLIDGCHRLYKAAVTGRAEIPAFVLTAAETLLIRSDAVLGPPRLARTQVLLEIQPRQLAADYP